MPLLVIVGGRDGLLDSYDTRRRLARTTPHAVVRLRPDAPHGLRRQDAVILDLLQDARDRTSNG